MPGGNDNKPKLIAEKYSIDYCRRPLATRLWKGRWNWSALAGAVVLVAMLYVLQRNRVFQAAPVADVHSTFGANCATCHGAAWQSAVRLATLDSTHRSVADQACKDCHKVGDHALGEVPA